MAINSPDDMFRMCWDIGFGGSWLNGAGAIYIYFLWAYSQRSCMVFFDAGTEALSIIKCFVFLFFLYVGMLGKMVDCYISTAGPCWCSDSYFSNVSHMGVHAKKCAKKI